MVAGIGEDCCPCDGNHCDSWAKWESPFSIAMELSNHNRIAWAKWMGRLLGGQRKRQRNITIDAIQCSNKITYILLLN
ncbi:hypothetical protein XELAEV_18031449mg [Xenopus laevis]|uniref:Uncharacterized protein n=1 Tax=Xenopus laevis TaxID=8355 RepID=A0A974CPZ8_XENLA|nr:hypothetical protein XELAEV_18031449mg [Xenopus laevis]